MSFPAKHGRGIHSDGQPSGEPGGAGEAYARRSELGTDHLLTDIGKRSVRGGAIVFAAQAVKAIAQFAAILVLVRLLPPAAFGLIAMTVALNTILDPLREFGLSWATIQKPNITQGQVSTLFWFNVGGGVLVAVGMFAAAPVIAGFYGQPELIAVTRWLALGFVLSGFSVQHCALLRRQMRFGAVAALETGAELIGFAVAIGLAIGGADYWALVVQRLVAPGLITAGCSVLCRWRPDRPSMDPAAGELLRFGGSMAGTSVIGLLARNIDQVMIGWFWGPGILGVYERAAKLLLTPLNHIVVPLYYVGMPALSRLSSNEERYRRAFGEMLEKLAMVTLPAAAMIVVTADWTTHVLFGPRWSEAAPLVACFAAIAVYQPSIDATGLLYTTQRRSAELLRAGTVDAALSIIAVLCALRYGTTAIAASLAATGFFVRVPVAFWLATRRGPVTLGQMYGTLLPPLLAGFGVAAAVWMLRRFALPADIAPAIGLLAALPTALLAAAVVFCALPRSRQALTGFKRAGKLLRGNA